MNYHDLLCCTQCRSKITYNEREGGYRCSQCTTTFPEHNGIIDFLNRADKEVEKVERYYQKFFEKDDPYHLRRGPIMVFPVGHNAKMEIVWNMLREFEDKKGLLLLDIGCGSSPEAFKNLEKNNNTVIYLDISQEALNGAKNQVGKNHGFEKIFIISNEMIPITDEALDIIFAGEIIEHVKEPKRFLDTCATLLKKNSTLILTTPNSNALTYRILGRKFGRNEQHISLQSYDSMVELLGGRFRILDAQGINQGIIGYRPDKIFNYAKSLCSYWANVFNKHPQWSTGLIFKCRRI